MLKNYLVTTFRNIRRQKGYAFINVVGLAVGLACSFFILHWVMNEISYDRFHEDGDRLYRVMRHGYLEENTNTWGSVPKPLADVLEADYPEVENAMLIDESSESLIAHDGEVFKREGATWTRRSSKRLRSRSCAATLRRCSTIRSPS